MPDAAPARHVSVSLGGEVFEMSDLVLSVAVAHGPAITSESLVAQVDGAPVDLVEVVDGTGVRRHVARTVPVGQLTISYAASVTGRAPVPVVRPIDPIEMTWPSRYCDSDRLANVAREEFADLRGADLVVAVRSWANQRLHYVGGSSRVLDGATEIYLANEGVCRDFAHLVIAVLRARGVPARLVSVYAPGLSPMDFHAVVEAVVDGQWYAVDATGLAPRASMLRIASGRDAADTAFMTVPRGNIRLDRMQVVAITDGNLPGDDWTALAQLG
jgi:transglutaminase-like putative cysteine protease